jgi:hypothetical protein
MWTCPKCKIEVEPDFDVCWSCGTSRDGTEDPEFDPELDGIQTAEQFEAETEARSHEDFVTVATYWKPSEAIVARSRLEAEGIRAYLADEQLIAMDWLLANAVGGIKLQVAQHDQERAREVLADVSRQPGANDYEEETDEFD